MQDGKQKDDGEKRERLVQMQRKDNKIDALEKKVKELQEQLEAANEVKEDKKKQTTATKKAAPTVR